MEGKRFFIIDEDKLRAKILELSPELRRDTERMADLIRELVKLEREKRGLDNPRGTLELCHNKEKRAANDPDLMGNGRVAGRFYRASAWLSENHKLRILLSPKDRK
jgi:hypothetical protein